MSPELVSVKKSTIDRASSFVMLTRSLSAIAPNLAAMAAAQLFVTVVRHGRPAREQAWADGAFRTSVPSPHGDLAAWVWGDGPGTVLLVHGWAGRGLQLGAVAQPLVAAGLRVVAYDGPAHGDSPGRRTNIFELTEGLHAVAAAWGPVTGTIAHSLGTTAVLLAAARRGFDPGRFVAISPMAATRTMTSWYGQLTGFSPAVVAAMRARLERRLGFNWGEIEPLHLADEVAAPTLVIHDLDDRELPASEGEALAGRLTSASVLRTEGLGHRRILRDPAVVAAATDFIMAAGRITRPARSSHQHAASAA